MAAVGTWCLVVAAGVRRAAVARVVVRAVLLELRKHLYAAVHLAEHPFRRFGLVPDVDH